GTIACLNGGLNNLIAATADNSVGIRWAEVIMDGVITNATSPADGAANTAAIISALGGGSYAAQLCNDFTVDSEGNTPCQAGNACYNDWFLPATDQLSCLYDEQIAIGGFSPNSYWSSTALASDPDPEWDVFEIDFTTGTLFMESKVVFRRVRCVRAFTP
ncbi:hypothetical protein QM427_08920, partial [Tatlockia sp. PL877]|nr:hypothetical protein [Legionella sp. PL877]